MVALFFVCIYFVQMENIKTKNNIFNIFIYFIIFFSIILSFFFINPIESGDTPHYDNQSTLLLRFGFKEYFQLIVTEFERPYYLYLGTIVYTSIFKFFFNDLWKIFFVASNLFLSFYIFFRLFEKLSDLIIFKLLFLFLYLFNIEQNQWNFYILGEILYNFLSCIIFFKIITNINLEKSLLNNLSFIILTSLVLIFTKPSGFFIFIFFISTYVFLYILRKNITFSFFIFIFLYIFLIFLSSSILFSFIYNFDLFALDNSFYYRLYEISTSGIVIDSGNIERLHSIEMGNNNLINYLTYFIYKFFYFFKFWDLNFWSFKHNLVNFLIFIPLYSSIFYSLLKYKQFSYKGKKIINVCMSMIVSIAIFHTLTIIDYSFRFRLATYCPMYYLLVLNLNFLKNKIFRNSLK